MKDKLIIIFIILIVIVAFLLFISIDDKKVEKTVSFTKDEITISTGERYQLELTNYDNEVSYKSIDTNIVNVNDSGLIVGKSEGKTKVRVSLKEDEKVCDEIDVNVIKKEILVEKIDLNISKKNLKINDRATIVVNYYPEDAVNKNVTWESSDNTILSVNNGEITAHKSGKAIVTAKTNNNISASLNITVEKLNDKVTIEIKNKVYDGKELEAVIKSDSNTIIDISYYNDDKCTNKVTTPKEVGTYYVIVKTKGNDMYEEFTTPCTKGVVIEKEKDPIIPSNVMSSDELFNNIDKTGISKMQIAVFSNGKVTSTKEYNVSKNEAMYISSASKSMLGIIASLMQEDNIINLDTRIDTYWLKLNSYDFNKCTSDWKYYLNSEETVRKYTKSGTYLAENHPTLKNLLTHSSTIKNMNMVHMIPGDETSEYFGGGMSKTYDRALFMLKHTSHQLFEQGGKPGTSTNYEYQNDRLTRSHALAGFTMQIAMKESINEYSRKKLQSKFSLSSNYGFDNGNSIYFGTKYKISANDLAKIISSIANNGVYNGNQVLKTNTVNLLKNKYSNLRNQTIAFDYINGKYIKFGYYKSIDNSDYYKLSGAIKNVTLISFDDKTNKGYVINMEFNNDSNRDKAINILNKLQNVFYK